ncbi:uncharacterized protein EKO05_0007259 [Ascochyta rabiei]|uniref:Uncharacterized protein n=1 Tax=Didymella rabiei TaxID=5454 RepID=A0A163H1I6_DIDRA|nr:uncharacterized protein EKO05_0007259 [Ascochyta rabiei]KZM25111.1 hypothetical protein ST47_g3743 [Ascochyta rabiei]UPX16876.1 hypothetical protein EKO05_0007259 [Ascochyta rabiei]
MAPNNDDPFDDLLTLEDTLYTTAHDQGVADGARAGRIEGRIFGLERGFEKFAALGELHGRGSVWGSRIPSTASTSPSSSLPPLATTSTRLLSNITLLYHLTDPPTFSTANTEISVADFDDRFKRAGAKAKVIERIVGETLTSASGSTTTTATDARSPERAAGAAKGRNVRLEGEGKKGGKKGDDSMEDFGGSRLIG